MTTTHTTPRRPPPRRVQQAAAILVLSVAACPSSAEVSVTYPDDALAVVTFDNEFERYVANERVHVVETPRGSVTLLETLTSNGPGGCCPDRLEVMDMPAGISASPSVIDVEEGGTGQIVIREFVGM